ncbi:hypothetical protein ACHAXM_001460 [Skeletonema potamos]|jgi:hypothetical protein
MKGAATSTIVAIAASVAGINAFVTPSCTTNVKQPSSSVVVEGVTTDSTYDIADAPTAAAEEEEEGKIFDAVEKVDKGANVIEEFVYSDIGEELRQQQTEMQLPSDYDVKENDILASLFGSNERRNDFFCNVFRRRVACFPRLCTSNQHRKLLEPPMSGIDLPSLYDTNDWISLRKRGSRDMLDKEQTSYIDLTGYIAGGGSAIIPIIPGDYLYTAKVQIEHALGLEEDVGTSMNIYHSGPSAVALNIHYDAYPVLVLQLKGEKEWIIQNNNFGQKADDVTDWRNVTLTQGDLLYVPKGVFHAATGDPEQGSTHATIGLP